ncbi:MAG: hypothetical protein AB8H86_01895 [Polyangiales bacterium]
MRFSRFLLAAFATAGFVVVAPSAEAQEIPTDVETYEYTVREGDTCAAIAGRAFGNRRRYDIIHLYNPNMGPPPHRLVAGSTLTLPRNTGPDARITAFQREVQARQPSATDWRSASRGLGLFRGWRVNTLEESTAELTFQDDSQVHMRENTLVIIYGGSDESARRVTTTRAELQRGTLRSHLGALRLQVDTPGSETSLDGGDAVVSVDPEGTSRVSNHDGGQARVRSSSGGTVRVAPGFGSAVARGQRPTRPRPLPPAPTWVDGPARFSGIASEGGSISGEWSAVETARVYRIEVRKSGEEAVVAAAEVPNNVTRFEVHRLPAGEYEVRLSTLDNEFFESRPSQARTVHVALARLVIPGVETEDALPDPSADVETPRALLGTIVAAPEGLNCSLQSAAPSTVGPLGIALTTTGDTTIQCSGADGEYAPFVVNVVGATASPPAEEDTERPEAVALTTGVSSEVSFEVRSDLELPSTVELSSDALIVEDVRREGTRWYARVTASSAGEHPLHFTLGGTVLLSVNVVSSDAEVEPPPPAQPEPTRPAPIGQEALGIWQQPSLFGLRDPRPGQHAASVGVGSGGDTPFGDESDTRLAVGIEADIGGVGRIVVGAHPGLDFEGGSSFYAGFGLHYQSGGLALYGELASWFPTGGDDVIVLAPSLTLGYEVSDRVLLRTRQGGLISMEDGPRSWASAYGADVRIAGAFFAGVEANLALGRESGEFLSHFGAGLALGLALERARVSLALHRSITDDLRAERGDWVAALGVRVMLPGRE